MTSPDPRHYRDLQALRRLIADANVLPQQRPRGIMFLWAVALIALLTVLGGATIPSPAPLWVMAQAGW